jgi:predicted nucleotidyltransferase
MNVFQTVADAARERGLSFIVIGGLAVIEYGYSRVTTDFDLLISGEQKDSWHSLLLQLGYELTQEKDTFRQYIMPAGTSWPVDLMFVNPTTFATMIAAAKTADLEGAHLPLVSLEHLLALKLHALKHSHLRRFLKDFQDVIHLVQLNKINLRSPEIRDLFLKYGNADLYGKICRACEVQ